MKSYQVDLFCDGPGCKAVITSDTDRSAERAEELVDTLATTRNWRWMHNLQCWLCPECYAKGTVRLSQDLTTKTS